MSTRFATVLAFALMAASGFAALGYQIVWTQQSALWLGHESAAVLAVVAAFFGGLACGAFVLGPPIEASARPGRWYAACEAAIGLWGLALAMLLPPIARGLLDVVGPMPSPAWHWAVAFLGTFLLLLPATAAMGATLPAMVRVLAESRRRGAPIALLYAGNTVGAVAGVLAAAFWLVPVLGLVATAFACMVLNVLAAAAALVLFAAPAHIAAPAAAAPAARGALAYLAATGFLGIGYEVLVVRVLSQVTQNTVYTFAILLAVYLAGTALGAAVYDRWLAASDRPDRQRDGLLQLLAASCLAGLLILGYAGDIGAWLRETLAAGVPGALFAETALALAVFLLPTAIMGALFSHLATRASAAGTSFGRALGVNTAAAAAAPALFGVWLLPALGAKLALVIVAAGYAGLASRSGWRSWTPWASAAACIALAAAAPPLAIVDVPDGGTLVSRAEGALATVSIVEDARGVGTLHINNRVQEGSTATRFADARQALVPILLHPAPRRALFLGLGTGVTARSAAEDPQLRVDAVELLPEVIAASSYFTRREWGETSAANLTPIAADARRYVRAADRSYDVIVADNFHPARSGSGALYTAEHFAAVRQRLAAGGVFCQWLPLHQLDLPTLRSIVRTFASVFPDGAALLATNSLETPVVGLIAHRDGERFDVARVRERLASVRLPERPGAFGITDELALFGTFFAGPSALARFADGADLNTDDRPVVAYRAPFATYANGETPGDRLIRLLRETGVAPAEILAAPHDETWTGRLAAYWQARNGFVEAGRGVQPTTDVKRMLAQVREPLLAVLRTSADFRPAADPLIAMAAALARVDPDGARALFDELTRLLPANRELAAARLALPASPDSGAAP